MQSVLTKEAVEILVTAISGLPLEQRQVVLLRHTAGLPFHEIAEIVGSPLNTIKSRMRYALEKLERELTPYFGDWL